jgi:hypothetical protein
MNPSSKTAIPEASAAKTPAPKFGIIAPRITKQADTNYRTAMKEVRLQR